MKIPKLPKFKKKYVILVAALLVVGGGTAGALKLIHTNKSYSFSFNHPQTIGASAKPSGSAPSVPQTSSKVSTPTSSSTATTPVESIPSIPSVPPTSTTAPDPSQCANIKAQEQTAIASLSAQSKQLEATIQGEQSSIGPNGYKGAQAVQIQAEIQTNFNQLNADISQISAIEVPYTEQLGQNDCS